MKKLIILLTFIFSILISSNIYASNQIKIVIDGNTKVFTPGPIIENGSTLVPMRSLFEDLGASVNWDNKTRSVTAIRNSTKIKLIIGNYQAYINDKKVYLSGVPKIINEKTYVPLRFVSEALEAEVYWDSNTRTITIKDKTKAVKSFTLVDTQRYELRQVFEFKNYGDNVDTEISIPIFENSDSPYQKDEEVEILPQPYEISTDDNGRKIAKIKATNISKGQSFFVTMSKKIQNSGIKYSINQNNISSDYSNFSEYNKYIKPETQIESDNKLIINKAQELSKNVNNSYLIAKNIYEFVNLYLTYDKNEQYTRKGALSALSTTRGICGEYSKLVVALLRANKIPARSVVGFWIQDDFKKNFEYNTWYDLSDIGHEWPEFYIPNYGWIICEPTYLYTINGEKTVPWLEFANQKSNGHIIYNYEPNGQDNINWNLRGYGKLDLRLDKVEKQIKKLN